MIEQEDVAKEILWRLEDIRESLLRSGIGGRLYNLDEWSVPIKNLDGVIRIVKDVKNEE